MSKMRKVGFKLGKCFALFALMVGVVSTSATCRYILHQPKVPEKMKNKYCGKGR